MTERDTKVLSGSIFDETTEITIAELCEVCSIDIRQVDEMINEGILEPTGGRYEKRRVPHSSIRCTRTVVHMQRDLGVNLAGAALILDLLDRIENLQDQLRRR